MSNPDRMEIGADVEQAVRHHYGQAAETVEPALCCPTHYDDRYLRVLPQAIRETDYGCGDPSPHVRPGQTVLDLGSGSGKLCYILSQIVGRDGRVIGVDFNEEMLELAERHRLQIADAIGYDNVEFRKGHIQNLRRDLRLIDRWLAEGSPRNSRELAELEARARRLERDQPLIGDERIDVVVSNCVLNLVRPEDKPVLFGEIYRVLRNGGRAVVSDIVSDEDVPEELQRDPELWSGCISGAMRDEVFLQAFLEAGFHGVEILRWANEPWRVVAGIEFRSVTISAWKGKTGPCWERRQAVIYKGPWSAVEDDDHHRFVRGQRVAVCDKTFRLLQNGSYAEDLIFLEPVDIPAMENAEPFDCARTSPRHPKELKESGYRVVSGGSSSCCGTNGSCG